MSFDPGSVVQSLAQARRINVTGNVATGKTTLATAIALALALPLIHLDHLVWRPGWKKHAQDTRYRSIATAAARDAWVIDGVSSEVRTQADAVIFIDLRTTTAMRQTIGRALRLGLRSRPEMGPGYPEIAALRPALRLARRFNRHVRPTIMSDLATAPKVVHLTAPAQVTAMLGMLGSRASR